MHNWIKCRVCKMRWLVVNILYKIHEGIPPLKQTKDFWSPLVYIHLPLNGSEQNTVTCSTWGSLIRSFVISNSGNYREKKKQGHAPYHTTCRLILFFYIFHGFPLWWRDAEFWSVNSRIDNNCNDRCVTKPAQLVRPPTFVFQKPRISILLNNIQVLMLKKNAS
jgi:hypothetical protein